MLVKYSLLVLLFGCQVSGYILGEKEGEVGFLRCWQNGELLLKCPSGLEFSWNHDASIDWHESEVYQIVINMTWSDELRSKVVYGDDSVDLVSHVNIHSCQYATGSVCVPFAKATADGLITHTEAIQSSNDGLFNVSVSLTEGEWNIIAHGRLFLNDSRYYQLESESCKCDDQTSSISLPFKLDFAIGSSRSILPPLSSDDDDGISAVHQAVYTTFGVIGSFVFVYLMYKMAIFCKHYQHHFGGSLDGRDDGAQEMRRIIQQERRRLFISVLSDTLSLGLGLVDVITDLLAMLFIMEHPDVYSPSFVALYAILTLVSTLVSVAFFMVTLQNIVRCLKSIDSGFIGTFERLHRKSLQKKDAEPKKSRFNKLRRSKTEMLDSPRSSIKFNKSNPQSRRTSILSSTFGRLNFKLELNDQLLKQEAASIFIGVFEDLPFFILNAVALTADDAGSSRDLTLLFSFALNGLALGYRVSISKMFMSHLGEKAFLKASLRDIQEQRSLHQSQVQIEFNQDHL